VEVEAAGVIPGTDSGLSSATVPIVASDRVIGAIAVENFERENAFGDSELRVLQTIAASMGVALENARLFKAEQERVAELAVINSIQQALAAELDLQAIIDLVGDKLREIFRSDVTGIALVRARQGSRRHALPVRSRQAVLPRGHRKAASAAGRWIRGSRS
jgi:GAF domain-containing protein